jgi:ABC-type bacteriocin/lantibiotic exporter with double-glycine peptidase domain
MKNITTKISLASFGLLIGTGLQVFFWGLFTQKVIVFDDFTFLNWFFQVIYWAFLITFALQWAED